MEARHDMENLKDAVKEKYGQAALRAKTGEASSCCGSSCGCGPDPITTGLYEASETTQVPQEAL